MTHQPYQGGSGLGQAESCPSRIGWFLVGGAVLAVAAFVYAEDIAVWQLGNSESWTDWDRFKGKLKTKGRVSERW